MARSTTHMLTMLAFVVTFATTMVAAAPAPTYESLHAPHHGNAGEYDASSPPSPGRVERPANLPYIEVRCGGGQPNLLWTLYGVAIGVLATIAVTQELQRVRCRRDRLDRAAATPSRVPADVRSCACTAAAAAEKA